MDVFITSMQLFTLQDVHRFKACDTCGFIVMFLFWTLILMASIHCGGYIGEQVIKMLHSDTETCSDKETN